MPTTRTTTIGINVGSRYVGTAVIIGTELRDGRIRVIRRTSPIEKFQTLTSILSRLLDAYSPTLVAMKKLHPSRSSSILDRMGIEAKEFLEQHGVGVHEFTLAQLKARLLPGQRANKINLAEYMVSQYPILFEDWDRERSLRRPYRMAMFEAVALANASLGRRDN